MSKNPETIIDELLNADPRAPGSPPEDESGYLTETQFNHLTQELICVATASNILPADALAALAKALGILSAFTARREGRNVEEILRASQDTVASFATAAESQMKQSPDAESCKDQSCCDQAFGLSALAAVDNNSRRCR